MSLSNEQLLLLDALAYYDKLSDQEVNNNREEYSDKESKIKIENFINNVKVEPDRYNTVFNGVLGYNDSELGMDRIIDLIDNDDKLKRLEIVYPISRSDKTTSSVCLVDKLTSEVYVIYVGNYAEENYKYCTDEDGTLNLNTWIENAMGAVEADTDEQKRDLEFYEEAIAAARDSLNNQDGDLNITVSGHSTGGNHAQYVTTVYKESMGKNYNEINDIDRCVSFDGQGFSNAFLEKYSDDIKERADRITSYCPTESIVGSLMNDIPGTGHKYIEIGDPKAMIIGLHMPAEKHMYINA